MTHSMPRKILAVTLSAVLAFSVMSVSALTAFADSVVKLTPAKGLVYDTAYGVFGGKYALMTKQVVFKGVYTWSEDKTPVDMKGSVTDIVDADGNVALHTFSASGVVQDADKHPETVADWSLASLRGWGRDVEAGLVAVRSLSGGKYGAVTPAGKEVIAAKYDRLTALDDNDVCGLIVSLTDVTLDTFDNAGNSLGSFTFTASESNHYWASGGPSAVSVGKRGPYVVISHQGASIAILQKENGKYVKASVKNVYAAKDNGTVLLRGTDDYAYVQAADGTRTRLAKVSDSVRVGFDGKFIVVRDDSTGPGTASCYTLDGALVGGGALPFVKVVDDYALFGNWDSRSDDTTCAIFDAKGNKVNEFEAEYATLLFNGTRTYTSDGPSRQIKTADGVYYRFSLEGPYSTDEGTLYNLRVYSLDGKLVKDLGKGFGFYSRVYDVTSLSEDFETGNTVLGYEVSTDYSDENIRYYDVSLNQVASADALNDNGAEEGDATPRLALSNSYKLADGTSVEAQVYRPKKFTGEAPYSSKIVYADGTPVKLGGYNLGICFDMAESFRAWNSVKHGNADMWWATNDKGKWGAVDSKGTVLVPFEYDGYFDSGFESADYAMVKKADKWYFLRVTEEGQESQQPSDPTTEGFTRLAGDNALDTMKSIVTAGGFPKGGTVVLANAWGFHDALTAAGIAGLLNAPVVMTDGVTLSAQAQEMIALLAPKQLIVCGGEATISKAVAEAAQKAAGGATLERCAGDNAAGTAVMIFAVGVKLAGNDMAAAADDGSAWADTAIVATSGTYHDALAAAPLSYAAHLPIFMTEWTGALSDATIKAMKDGGIKNVYIAGGTYWIPESTAKQLGDAGIKVVKRLAGDTAVETSAAIATEAVAKYKMTADNLGVATTTSHYDALAGAAFCGKNNSVLLLANDENLSSINGFAMSHASEISSVFALGGTSSVTPAMTAALAKVLQ